MIKSLTAKIKYAMSVLDRDGNLGLIGGSFWLAGSTALLFEHKGIGFVLGVIGTVFAVRLGLLKRAEGKAKRASSQE
ncbi:hypothetical protein H8F21_13840 [Pseudomonas sp. P66]|uniref:Holin n=1 Tax=Pseudomonas arcuscaelestis TaxID=2710591 RepID=A0ABS2BYG0_9PSED|nr:hypothetical protein [Pseudomonas arcuscaelestis]MBM5458647.1 hypothetical protein [Pseudomonas arcuscaelestis]